MKTLEEPLIEAGVEYWRGRHPTLHPVPRDVSPFHYRWESPDGLIGEGRVYVRKRQDLHTLLCHWNRSGWKYTEVLTGDQHTYPMSVERIERMLSATLAELVRMRNAGQGGSPALSRAEDNLRAALLKLDAFRSEPS